MVFVRGEDEVGRSSHSGNISGHIDRVRQLHPLLVGDGVRQPLRRQAVWSLVQQAVRSGHLCRDVGQVKVDVEGGQVPHQAAVSAVPVIQNGINRVLQIRTRGIYCYRDRASPPVQQGLQVVKKSEVPMSGVGYSLVAVELFGSPDVVVEDPVVSSHALAEVVWLVEALDRVRDGEGWAGFQTLGWRLAGGG